MAEQRTLSVIVVNYNHGALLPACLDSVFSTAKDLAPEVIVVDNGSRDGSVETIQRLFPPVRCLANGENLGFARAANQGLAQAHGEYLLLLNPDTELLPGALPGMVAFLAERPEAGAVGPRILNPDGTLQHSARSFPDYWTALSHRSSLLTRWFPRNPLTRRYLLTDWDHGSLRQVDWVSGACLMTRRAVMEAVGPLDEAYFLFVEDVDWCRRVWEAGWKVYYLPEARVIHHMGVSHYRSGRRVERAAIVGHYRGMLHYYRKYLRRNPPVDLAVALAIWGRCGLHLLGNALRRP